MKSKTKYRVFKLSIGIPFAQSCMDSRVYKIENRLQLIYPVSLYSFGTLLLGFWNFYGALESLKALHTNLTGGEDYTEIIDASNHDDFTNKVWNNLTKESSSKIDRAGVDILMDIQDEFMSQNTDAFSEYNVRYLRDGLSRKGYRGIADDNILDFLDAIQIVMNQSKQ